MEMETKRVYSIEINGADSVNELKSAIEQLNEKLKTLNETSKEYKETLEQLTELQGKLAQAMSGIADSAGKTSESINEIKESIEEVGDVISEVTEGFEEFGDVDPGVVDAFIEGVIEGMNEVTQSIDGATGELENLGNTNLDGLKETIDGITESLDNVSTATSETEASFEKLGNANSVKELKDQISELRDRLVTLQNGSKEYQDTVNELIDKQVKLKEVMNAGKNEVQAAEGSYNALSQRMSALKQVWKEVTDEATRNEIGKQINDINTQLKALDASIGNNQRNVGNYKSALDGLDGSFVNWKQELKECKEAMQQLDPSTQAYADAMARAAELTHNLSEQQEMIKYASTDVGDQLENVRGIASSMAAGFSAVNAAMGLFGEENEEVQQAMLKVQQAMALVQGMQGMEGFWKRTKGLSESLGLATKTTKSNTVATKANAQASAQDAAAKGTEAAATEGTTIAQQGLNAAMKANPIGFIIGLIATLVTAYTLLKDNIKELIGVNNDLTGVFNKIGAVFAGFANVIKKSVIAPIKLAIVEIRRFKNVAKDLITFRWGKIGKDAKKGFAELKDTVSDTLDVVSTFNEGYNKKIAEQNDAARKKEAAKRQKDLENQIKDNEAKYGSDWKYTEEGKKIYDELFKVRMAQYSEDSEEYREAQRDKWASDREFAEKQQKETDKANQEAQKKAEDAAKARKKITEDNLKSLEKAYSDFYGKFNSYISRENKNYMSVIDGWDDWTSKLIVSFNNGSTVIQRNLSDLKKYLMDTFNISKEDADNFTKQLVDLYYDGTSKIKKLINGKTFVFEVSDQFIEGLQKQYGFTRDEAVAIIDEIKDNWHKADYEKMVNTSLVEIEKDFYNFDRTVKQVMAEVKSEYDLKDAISGITIPDEATAHTENIFTMLSQNARAEIIKVEDEVERLYKILAGDEEKSPYFGKTKEELGQLLPSFQKLLDKLNELNAKEKQLELDKFKDISDIYKTDWENRIEIVKKGNEAVNDIAEQNFKEQINNAIRWQGVYGNAVRDLYEDRDYLNETYNEQKGQLERLRDMYLQMAEDENLTFEEKENAKREAAKVTGEIIQLEYDKEAESLKIQKGLIKEWTNAVKDAVSGVGDILGSLGNYYTGLMELEQARIDQLVKDGKISEDEAKSRYEQQKKNFENSKKLQIAETWINGLSAAIGAYQSMASIPYVGPVLGAAAAAAALALAGVNAAKIQATTFDNPYGGAGSSSSSSSSTNFQLPNVMELEPNMGRNITGMNDIDSLNNDGSGKGRGRGETAIRAYVVESEVSASQELANKRANEVTF